MQPHYPHNNFSSAIETMKVFFLSIAAALISSVHGQSTRGTSSPTSDTLAKAKSAKIISKSSKVAGTTDPGLLAVQMAESCVLGKDEYGGYFLRSSHWRPATNVFSDRGGPRIGVNLNTSLWFAKFNDLFDDGKGAPNAAVTFVGDNIETEDQVLVAVFEEAYNKSGDTYGYKISQSSGQTGGGQVGNQTVIEDILGGEDSKTIEDCSLFIDDLSGIIGPSFIRFGLIVFPFWYGSVSAD